MKFTISSLYNLFDWVKEGKFGVDTDRIILSIPESKVTMVKEFISQITQPVEYYNALCHFGIDELFIGNYIYFMRVSETDKSILSTIAILCHYSEATKIVGSEVSFKIEDIKLLKLLEDFCTVIDYVYNTQHSVYGFSDKSTFRYNFVNATEKIFRQNGYRG